VKTDIFTALAVSTVLGGASLAFACGDGGCADPGDPLGSFGGPEGSASCSSIQGNLQFGSNSNVTIDIGGYIPCDEHDRVTVGGLLTFNGTLHVQLIGSFVPEPGDRFRVFQYGSRQGDFQTMLNETGIAGLIVGRQFFSTYMDVVMSGLNGDTDLDGDVDFSDLLTVAQNYDQTPNATWFDGDFNDDMAVNFSDLLVVAQNYGLTLLNNESLLSEVDAHVASSFSSDWSLVQSSVNTPLPLTIPEPTSLALLAPLGLMLRRRR